jgi:hypothetical protein
MKKTEAKKISRYCTFKRAKGCTYEFTTESYQVCLLIWGENTFPGKLAKYIFDAEFYDVHNKAGFSTPIA